MGISVWLTLGERDRVPEKSTQHFHTGSEPGEREGYNAENSTIDRNDMQLGKASTKHPSLFLSFSLTFYCPRRIIGRMLRSSREEERRLTLQLPCSSRSQRVMYRRARKMHFSEYGWKGRPRPRRGVCTVIFGSCVSRTTLIASVLLCPMIYPAILYALNTNGAAAR